MEYYSAMGKKEILSLVTTCIDISEVSGRKSNAMWYHIYEI